MRKALSGLAALGCTVLMSTNAFASFHEMKIVEVFAGDTAHPTSQYIMLQMYAPGQTFLSGHNLTLYTADGTAIPNAGAQPNANLNNGADQAYILIGTAAVETEFGVTPDFALTGSLTQAGGKVCYDATAIDCFAWGNYAPALADLSVGTPFAALTTGMAAHRKIAGATLAITDDTNVCSADFVAAAPAPKNNNFGVPDAGTSTSSGGTDGGTSTSSSSGSTSSTSSSASSSSGSTSSSGASSGTSGVSTTPTPGTTATAAPTAAPAGSSGDSGCNVTNTNDNTSGAIGMGALALGAIALVMSRLRRTKR